MDSLSPPTVAREKHKSKSKKSSSDASGFGALVFSCCIAPVLDLGLAACSCSTSISESASLYFLNGSCFIVVLGSMLAVGYILTPPRDWYFIPVLTIWVFFVFNLFYYLEVAQPTVKGAKSKHILRAWTHTDLVIKAYTATNWRFLLRCFLWSSVLCTSYFLFLELVWTTNTALIFSSTLPFANSKFNIDGVNVLEIVSQVGCDVKSVITEFAEVFFAITNDQAVIGGLTAFGGVYFDVVMFRMRARSFLVDVYPFQQQACDGLSENFPFQGSNICQAVLVVMTLLIFVVPFSAFKQARQAMESPIFWLGFLVMSGFIALDVFLAQDIGMLMLDIVVQTYSRTTTYFGNIVLACLIVTFISSTFLILPRLGELIFRKSEGHAHWRNFLASQGFLFCIIGAGLSVAVAFAGLPISKVKLVGTKNRPNWPVYADYNSFELAILQSTGLESLILNVITNTTKAIGVGAQEIINLMSDAISSNVPSVCTSAGIGSVCVGGDLIGPAVTSTLDGLIDDVDNWVIQGEETAIPLIYNAAVSAVDEVTSNAATLLDNALGSLIQKLAVLYYDVLVVFQQVENILSIFDQLVPFIPLFIVIGLLLCEAYSQFFPSGGGKNVYLLVMTWSVAGCVTIVFAYFQVQSWLADFDYRLSITWNWAVLILDFFTLEWLLATSYMMYTFHDPSDTDTDLQHQMEHWLDEHFHHHHKKKKKKKHKAPEAGLSEETNTLLVDESRV